MTDSKHSPPLGGSVLDPEWEEVLRRGQEDSGEAGSVEAELAFVHLLRHAREPEALAPDQLDAIWSQIGSEIGSELERATPWWRKAWVWWSAPALAAAAVLVVVIVDPSDEAAAIAQHDPVDEAAENTAIQAEETPLARNQAELAFGGDKSGAQSPRAMAPASAADRDSRASTRGSGARAGGASPFEVSFAKLAPHGHVAIRVSVDQSRDELRSQLLAKARGGGR